jgi:signal transduction histidine kinase
VTDLVELQRVPTLAGIPDEELAWLATHMEFRSLEPGEVLAHQGDDAQMEILIEGEIRMSRRESSRRVNTFALGEGQVSGRLPFSRMRQHVATIIAQVPTRVGLLDPVHFGDMHVHTPVLLERLVHMMVDRAREYTRFGAQAEKLLSLGTMSAGLAHELNNPASAARRTAHTLTERLQRFDELSSRLLRDAMFGVTTGEPFAPIYGQVTAEGADLDPLIQSDREDELSDWLEDQGVAEPWNVASTMVNAGLTLESILQVSDIIHDRYRADFLAWLQMDLEMRMLSHDLLASTDRISELVGAMKSYSYMDQGQDRAPTDIHEGLRNTLTILDHKIRRKSIEVVRRFGDVPPVAAHGGELNQVWTNLIDNAVSALHEGGTITIRTHFEELSETVVIEVRDDGPGVPDELRSRIFEPFFTTKGVGEGTGMGLDIAHRIVTGRHFGTLQLSGGPGDTCFTVRLPLS